MKKNVAETTFICLNFSGGWVETSPRLIDIPESLIKYVDYYEIFLLRMNTIDNSSDVNLVDRLRRVRIHCATLVLIRRQ